MKHLLLIIITILLSMNVHAQTKVNLLYVGDPMCSWCYGVAGELQELVEHYGNDLNMEIIVGGLRGKGDEEWNDNFKGFLKHHWEDVNKRSGAPFQYKIFEKDNFEYDTEPACRAVVTVRELEPAKEWAFFKAVQKHFYYDNEDPNYVAFYEPICKELGIDYNKFKTLWSSDRLKVATSNDFKLAKRIGATGFPSLYLKIDDEIVKIASGYATSEEIIQRIENR